MRSIKQLMDLHGRVALITGGAGHIGRVFCEVLAELGADIAVVDQTAQACVNEAARITEQHRVRTLAVPADLANERAVRSIPRKVMDELGGLDVLINCAAVAPATGAGGWAVPFCPTNVRDVARGTRGESDRDLHLDASLSGGIGSLRTRFGD